MCVMDCVTLCVMGCVDVCLMGSVDVCHGLCQSLTVSLYVMDCVSH